jgi:hypothetical protein
MQAILLIFFLLLYIFNVNICAHFYPEYLTDYDVWEDWYYLRGKIYEVMFFMAILIPFTKVTKLSKSLALFGVILIVATFIDKILNMNETMLRDWMVVIPCAIAVANMVYQKEK